MPHITTRRSFPALFALFIVACLCSSSVSAQTARQEEPQRNKSEEVKGENADPFAYTDHMPEYPGGLPGLREYLVNNLHYPEEARKNNIQGRVVVRFIVETDGRITHAEVMRSLDPQLDAEAMRVVKAMSRWKPGSQNGQLVRVYYTLPVSFRLK